MKLSLKSRVTRLILSVVFVLTYLATAATACNGVDEQTNPNNISQKSWRAVECYMQVPKPVHCK